MDEPPSDLERLLDRAKAKLGTDASPATNKLIQDRLKDLSTILMLEWLVGDQRFEKQSEQTEYWLSRIYDELLTDEQPDGSMIYERFGFSLPRSDYLARLLRARRMANWRRSAISELSAKLEVFRNNAENTPNDQVDAADFELLLTPGAADELKVIYNRIALSQSSDVTLPPPKYKPTFSKFRFILIPCRTLLEVLNEVKNTGDQHT